MNDLLAKLRHDWPNITFSVSDAFSWSPKQQRISYAADNQANGAWSLLHELGHALLQHKNYQTDFELVKLEAAAWAKAAQLGQKYGYQIDPDHIEDCLDTYRDWLHQRSACPTCRTTSLQSNMTTYCCYNCDSTWTVSRARLCRPYRRLHNTSI